MGKLVQGKCQTTRVQHNKSEKIRYLNKGKKKDKLAKQCEPCASNKNGFCDKLQEWCYTARISCEKCVDKPKQYNYQKKYEKRNKIRNKKNKNKNKNNEKLDNFMDNIAGMDERLLKKYLKHMKKKDIEKLIKCLN